MADTLIIIENKSDWEAYYPSENVVTFEEYLDGSYNTGGEDASNKRAEGKGERLRVINLCRNSSYLSAGYYCSLLAEARGHGVIPSVRTLNDLSKRALYRLELDYMPGLLAKKSPPGETNGALKIVSFFGTTINPEYTELARKLFEHFPCPVLEISLVYDKGWKVDMLKIRSHHSLDDSDETAFANALDEFSLKVWRKRRSKKQFRYDLAILIDEEEKFPPSNKTALKRFIAAGKSLGIDCELITQRDYLRLPEYDGLFIRATTSINHYTYRFAKRAEMEGMVVIDDPTSILRCTNKIYLADLFRNNKVPAPQTELLFKGKPLQIELLEAKLDYPMVLKIPDGAFSVGVEKVSNREALQAVLARLFEKSTLILAQEFLYTEFDWRIGVLNNKPIYACRYYMVRNHWQIYQHGATKTASGNFETLPTFEAPKAVLDAAIRATRPIGNGFYGVDIKEKNGTGYVIEVNDNPSIDSGVEDHYLGDELYKTIFSEFLRRMELRGSKK
ncbi:RimK family protein [Alkalimarinus alittae]|uniref:RimK family protein n=1 Tax=Alkalimarinus alittae TaxID=2961619 RepID=A0ABY6N021_9ALTE|nr:RimK family protein [Alkalimarinus alittae]UZE95344.1 RimK family protein [Alkalimarinus alittae]